MINKDVSCFEDCSSLWVKEIDYSSALTNNCCIERSVREPKNRILFYSDIKRGNSLEMVVKKLTKVSIFDKGLKLTKRIVKRIIRYR